MNISRGEVSEFRYSSTIGITEDSFLNIGTANNDDIAVRITDIKMSCATTVTVKFYSEYGTAGNALEFDLPANSVTGLQWELPPRFFVKGTTGATRNMVASASVTGIKYTVSGYIEK